jgi:hypothetical protein
MTREEKVLKSQSWWSSLSINQMKEYRDKYHVIFYWNEIPVSFILEIWEGEGMPE